MFCDLYCAVKHDEHEIVAVPLYCNTWKCEHCADRRRRQLQRLAISGRPNTFLTLTVNPQVLDSPEARAQALVKAWRTVVRRAKQHYGYDKLPFLAIFERTERGEPHLHILLRCKWLDQKWLSAQMQELLASPIVDIRRIKDPSKVARYVCKYIAKAPHKFAGTKRYWRSQDYEQTDDADDDTADATAPAWQFRACNIFDLAEELEYSGYTVTWRHDELHARWAEQTARRRSSDTGRAASLWPVDPNWK